MTFHSHTANEEEASKAVHESVFLSHSKLWNSVRKTFFSASPQSNHIDHRTFDSRVFLLHQIFKIYLCFGFGIQRRWGKTQVEGTIGRARVIIKVGPISEQKFVVVVLVAGDKFVRCKCNNLLKCCRLTAYMELIESESSYNAFMMGIYDANYWRS